MKIELLDGNNFSHENEIIKSVWFMFNAHFSFHSVPKVKVKPSLYLISKTDVQRKSRKSPATKVVEHSCALMTIPQTFTPQTCFPVSLSIN